MICLLAADQALLLDRRAWRAALGVARRHGFVPRRRWFGRRLDHTDATCLAVALEHGLADAQRHRQVGAAPGHLEFAGSGTEVLRALVAFCHDGGFAVRRWPRSS